MGRMRIGWLFDPHPSSPLQGEEERAAALFKMVGAALTAVCQPQGTPPPERGRMGRGHAPAGGHGHA